MATPTTNWPATGNYNPDGTLNGSVGPEYGNYNITNSTYDARGNKTQVVEGYSQTLAGTVTALRTTNYQYDKIGQLTQVTHDAVTTIADDMVTTTTGVVPTETYTYDPRGNVIKAVDADGAVTYSYYDDLDRKVVELRQLTASQWAYTAYAYDANGNLTNTKVYEGNGYSGTPPLGGTAPGAPSGLFRETAFTYDNLNRMLTTTVVSNTGNTILSGSWNGSSYATATGSLTTTYQYDANGNAVKLTDPNGNVTWSWYDALGRKTAQLDGEKYLTKWTYDAEGNVLSETRYASQFAGTPTLGTVPSVSANAADRITDFEYDLNGNRTKETRRNVAAWSVNATTGALSAAATTDSVIQYTYNALGQVTVKQISGNAVSSYAYDNTGHLYSEQKSAYYDANGNFITPQTDYSYDALGNLVATNQLGSYIGSYQSDARISYYRYGEGGRLLRATDPAGYDHIYYYDTSGRLKKDQYNRHINYDISTSNDWLWTVTEAKTTTYDLAGRALTQSVYSTVSSTFTRIDFASFEYNAFDQVTRQGAGANGSGAMYQAENKYDGAGRLIATNAGDGVWKVFAYDKNGNQTGAITSAGAATSSSSTFSGLLASVGSADLNGTYTRYDGRGQATQVIEEGRDLSGTVTGQTLTTTRTYNAFGEIGSETNALGATVTYSYNAMGRKIRSESPGVSITDETGAAYWVKPSEDYYYDLGGRLVATRDANGAYATTGTGTGSATSKAANTGQLTTYVYLGASGYDGSQGLVTLETHADGGKKQTLYDRMGDARIVRDELYTPSLPNLHQEERSYNKLGQLIEIKHNRTTDVSGDSTRLIDSFKYDQFGQRIQHWNSQYGSSVIEKTSLDALGRITRQADLLGYATITTYSWDGALTTAIGSGTVNLGGWVETTGYTGTTRSSTVKTDIYTRELYKSDLGTHVTTDAYDAAGRLSTRTTGSTTQTFQWYNTGLVKENVSTSGTETYGYDAVGQRTSQLLISASVTLVDAQTSYDALGRVTTWNQNAATYTNGAASYTTPQGTNTYAYDAVGNVRSQTSTYGALDRAGAVAIAAMQRTDWFRYDAMNRLVVNKGMLSGTAGDPGTTIVRGTTIFGDGTEIAYNAAGQRATVAVIGSRPSTYQYGAPYYSDRREFYNYDGAGRLVAIQTSQGTEVQGYLPPTYLSPAPMTPDLNLAGSTFSYDLMGRQTAQNDYYVVSSSTAIYSRTASYAANGALVSDSVSINRGPITTTNSTYSLTSTTGEYFLGSVARVDATYYRNGAYQYASTTVNSYQWWDGVMQNSIATTQSSTTYTTSFTYDGLGRLTQAYVGDNRPRTVSFRTDGSGQIIRRDERDNNNTMGDPHEIWYRFGGRQMSYVGNNSTTNVALQPSIDGQRALPGSGAFRYGATDGFSHVDTTNSYDAINSFRQGSAAGNYTVQQTGDTLAGIAQALWGDSSLWYKLAEANGLSADATLVEGQRLTIPQGVIRNQFNAGTVKPYDPSAAVGDVNPSTPQPPAPPKKGCGILGVIFLTIIAVAVTALLRLPLAKMFAGAGLGTSGGAAIGASAIGASSAAGIAGTAGAAMVGSVVSQGFGVATGIQEKFNWGAVAMAGIGAVVGGALGGIRALDKIAGNQFLGDVARGALGSAITQGIGVATGLQDKFSWAGVAAAGVGNGVGLGLGRELGKSGSFLANGFGNDVVSTAASALANAATRSAIEGSNFGDNILAALPDAIGGIMGRALGGAGARALEKARSRTQDDPVSQAPRTLGNKVADAVASQDTRVSQHSDDSDLQPGDIVVTARLSDRANPTFVVPSPHIGADNAGGEDVDPASPVASIDRGSNPYPAEPEDMSSLTAWQLKAKKALYQAAVAKSGQTFTDNAINLKGFDDLIALADAREAPGVAAANAAEVEILRAGLVPFDIGMGSYNIAAGNGELRDYLAVGTLVPVGKMLGTVGMAVRVEAKSFASFTGLKRYLGSPGTGNQWHHIVEQTPGNLKAFGAEMIHSTDNVVAVPTTTHIGKGSISAYYSSIQFGTNGLTVRQWLSTQSYQAQYQYGLDVLKRFGQ